jgi:hypothetical protein
VLFVPLGRQRFAVGAEGAPIVCHPEVCAGQTGQRNGRPPPVSRSFENRSGS